MGQWFSYEINIHFRVFSIFFIRCVDLFFHYFPSFFGVVMRNTNAFETVSILQIFQMTEDTRLGILVFRYIFFRSLGFALVLPFSAGSPSLVVVLTRTSPHSSPLQQNSLKNATSSSCLPFEVVFLLSSTLNSTKFALPSSHSHVFLSPVAPVFLSLPISDCWVWCSVVSTKMLHFTRDFFLLDKDLVQFLFKTRTHRLQFNFHLFIDCN